MSLIKNRSAAFLPRTLLALCAFSAILHSSAHALTFDNDIPAERVAIIERDIEFFKTLEFEPSTELAELLHTNAAVTPQSLLQWLNERVKYVVSAQWDPVQSMSENKTTLNYPNPTLLPEIDSPAGPKSFLAKLFANPSQSYFRDIGALYYYQAKQESLLQHAPLLKVVHLKNGATLELNSPHVGVVQMGDAPFSSALPNPYKVDAPVNSIFRMSILFHEARHSDGNGKSLLFAHSLCTKGMYKGNLACDRAANGSYAVQNALLRVMLPACRDCGRGDRAALNSVIDGNQKRIVLNPGEDSAIWDDQFESMH